MRSRSGHLCVHLGHTVHVRYRSKSILYVILKDVFLFLSSTPKSYIIKLKDTSQRFRVPKLSSLVFGIEWVKTVLQLTQKHVLL